MCGIAGICDFSPEGIIPVETLRSMAGALKHRGPDECGIYVDDTAGLAHTRLSIVDLQDGSQPIGNESGRLWIVYNGEVYNHPELRDELLRRGHRLRTRSDTEVVLHLFEEEGPACLERLNGQFAFAIWDREERRLFLGRDRVGIRPLYYVQRGSTLWFASEIKALFADSRLPRELDPVVLDQFLTFWTALPGRSVFRGVQELPPGCWAELADGELRCQRYWSIPAGGAGETGASRSFDEAQEEVRALLRDAVRIRLRADVTVSSYLSGGLDSSGLVGIATRDLGVALRTYGIRFGSSAFDEGEHQRKIAGLLGTDHREIEATDAGIGDSFADTVWHCEAPLLRTAPVPLFLLSSLVRASDGKVVLSGEGADEVFGGYNIFREAKVRRFCARAPSSTARRALLRRLYPYVFAGQRRGGASEAFFARGLERADDPLFSHLLRWESARRLQTFLADELRADVSGYDAVEELRGSLPEDFAEREWLARAQYLEMTTFLGQYLLSSQGDRVAMAHSVEIRVPFLDHRVVELAASLPASWKISGLREKHVLREALGGVLPADALSREKHPYRAPIRESLLAGELGGRLRDLLSDGTIERYGVLHAGKVARLLAKHEKGRGASEFDGMALALVVSIALLCEQFVAGDRLRRELPLGPETSIDFRTSSGRSAATDGFAEPRPTPASADPARRGGDRGRR